jgi:hypothetical protein
MRIHRMAFFLGCLTILIWLGVSPANAQQRDPQQDIWEEDLATAPQPWWRQWLDDKTMDRIMKGIEQRDPAKAKELAELRKNNLEEFKEELVQQGRQEVEQISREAHEARRQKDQAEFVEWLKANYPKEEEALTKSKEKDPQLYIKSFDRLRTQFGPMFDASKSNPELANVLKEDFELKKRRDDLVARIRNETADDKKQALGKELRDVEFRRYDLIVRRKEMAYERLQKKLEDLQKQINDSRNQIGKWKDPTVKQKNVQQHLESLTEGKITFKWD